MSNEREPMHGDDRVSSVYRELATERSPEQLDQRILAAARRDAATRYGTLRGWTRPIAWAAMIGISLVIVLEVTQMPDVADPLLEQAPGRALLSKPDRPAAPVGPAADAAAPRQPAALEAVAQPDTESSRAEADAPARNKALNAPGSSKVAPPETRADGATWLAAPSAASEQSHEPICPATDRAEPEDWLACIDALRESGLLESAQQELELFRAAFPDVPTEAPHK